MKKKLIYFFAIIGALSTLFFLFSELLSRTGSTMYGGAPTSSSSPVEYNQPSNQTAAGQSENNPSIAMPTIIQGGASGSANTSIAMQATKKPAENAMKTMIIRNATIALQVDNLSLAIQKITQLADNSGGYVVSSSLTQDSNYASNSRANISIRVPAQGLNNALTALKSLSRQVIQESVTGEDITQQYVNLESQLKNLQTAKEQLAKIMAGAKKTTDVLAVYQRLTETQGQIDLLEGQIKYYKESVAYSLITIDLSMTPVVVEPQPQKWKIAETFKASYHGLVDQFKFFTYGLIQFFVYFLPMLLLWLLLGFICYWIAKKIWSKL
jgi:hypothetical protein